MTRSASRLKSRIFPARVQPHDEDARELDGIDVPVLGLDERAIELVLLDSVDPLRAGDEVLVVPLEHDRELEVEEAARPPRASRSSSHQACAHRRVSSKRMSAIAVSM